MKQIYRLKMVMGLVVFSLLIGAYGSNALAQGIIIDHTCASISEIPESWIQKAKTDFRISYGHTSHGSQIITGMEGIRGEPGSLYWFDHDGTNNGLSLHDCEPWGDLGNPDRTSWADRTRQLLNTPGNDRNLIMWSWCGQVGSATPAQINTYLNLMNQLEVDYPSVTFIYMTGHLDGTGEDGNLNQRNNQIRQFCRENNKVLFDFADIESYDPDGNYFLDQGADDGCYYDNWSKNWAQEWCSAHPENDLCSYCNCAHSEPLNCNLKGRAFWYMMARLAGWVPEATLITLNQFSAIPQGNQIIITWTTLSEIDNAGFNLWRSQSESGQYVKINNGIIEALGGPTLSAEYSYVDDAAIPGFTYFYKLEDRDNQGVSTFHEPVSAEIPATMPMMYTPYWYWYFFSWW